ncbi:MAG: hypothetical protein ACR2G0_06765 [Chthoniobacterales bacterium]
MSDWNNADDRTEGAWLFLKRLDEDPQLRQECLADPARSREAYVQAGGFKNMPADVELRAIEDTKAARDRLHILAIPPVGQLGTREKFDVEKVWLAAWTRWDQ